MSEPTVDLDLLRTFQAIYRAGTMTGAAHDLHLSQPAVTARLKSLESACGTRLFDRTSRGCVPTSTAHDLARRCEEPLGQLASIAASLGRPTELKGTRLRLGAPAEYLAEQLAPALVPLTGTGMRVAVTLGSATDLIDDLLHGDLDLVVSTVRPPDRTRWTTLADEEFILVAAPAIAGQIDPAQLADNPARALGALPRITYDEAQSITRRWWQHVLGTRPPPAPTISVPDLRAIQTLVLAGAGISALPTYLVQDALAEGRLVELHPTEDPPINTLYLATMSHLREQPHVDAAWQALLAHDPERPRSTGETSRPADRSVRH